MRFPEMVLHLLNFVAPAFFMALALATLARWMFGGRASSRGFWMQAAITFVSGAAVLAIGLWVTGRDGKMATYVALVGVCGTVQWRLVSAVADGIRR
ncbi:MAG: hypothetical protein ACRYGA_12260 [Janthinobacterium lividum]